MEQIQEIKTGIELIAEERKRQIEIEGWTKEHDANYIDNELSKAGICYATPEMYRRYSENHSELLGWPWDMKWWKPTPMDRIKELVKAGALIAAEIDRLQNQQPKCYL